ncbi:hypothetical protein ZIOFF_066751 [Zingiber officinale]|uniref:Uncharacterized protein n=1 Tax=Zingiber officinale TaxID=94328 RepID=A0A8J5EZ72_ZINOF|nr:hypothetical protein ZIOFF_066751 [Zingiber officinale]
MKPLPNLREVFSEVCHEESRKRIMMGTLTKTLLLESLPYPLPQKNSHLENSFKILLHEEDAHGVNIARNQATIRTVSEICMANQQIGSLRESMTIEVILLLLMRQNHLPSLRNKWMLSGKSSSLKSLPLQSKSLQQTLKVLKLRANIADFSCDLTNTTETLNDLHRSACQLASKAVNYESGFKTLLLTNMESGRRMISMRTRCLNYRDKEDSLLDVLRGCNIDMGDEEAMEIGVFIKLLQVLELKKKRLLGQSFQMPVKPELQKWV